MVVIVASADAYLSNKLTEIVRRVGHRAIRTSDPKRVMKELKQPERIAIIDMTLEDFQSRGVLVQCRNLGAIVSNSVLCLCPNQDEELKKLARSARPAEVFLRFDIEGALKDFLVAAGTKQ